MLKYLLLLLIIPLILIPTAFAEIESIIVDGEVLNENLSISEEVIYDSIVIAENPRVLNAFGVIVGSLNVDQQIQLTIDLTNNQDAEQYFTTSVKVVRIHDNLLLYENSISGSFSSYQTWSPTYSWVSQVSGEYLVVFNTVGNFGEKNISLHDESTILITVETFEEPEHPMCGPGFTFDEETSLCLIDEEEEHSLYLTQKQLIAINYEITHFEKKLTNLQTTIDSQQVRLDRAILNNYQDRIDKLTTNIEGMTALQNIYELLIFVAQNQIILYS